MLLSTTPASGGRGLKKWAPMPGTRSSRRVWEIDLIRLLTFTAVISVHSLAFTQKPSNEVAAGFMMLLQFGREVFFAITGFVLTYSMIGKPMRLLSFWRRRVPFVLVPYIVWSFVYFGSGITPSSPGIVGWPWARFGHALLFGGAEYHLYFLVVTIQIYLLFPLILPFLRATARYAWPVLVVVAAGDLAWMGMIHYGHLPGFFSRRAYEFAPTYLMYILGGGYAALHWEKIRAYVVDHGRQLLAIAAFFAAAALAVYAWQLDWLAPRVANEVIQPALLASCIAAVLLLAVLAQRWVDTGMRWQRAIVIGSEISFGVYLAHPLILAMLTHHGFGNGYEIVPSPLCTIIGFTGAVVGASLFALAVRNTPLALFLIGRSPAAGSAAATRRLFSNLAGALPAISRLGRTEPSAPVPALAKRTTLSELSASGNQTFTPEG